MQTTTTMAKAYVDGCVNWFFPLIVNLSAIPKALIDITDTDPTVEQIEM